MKSSIATALLLATGSSAARLSALDADSTVIDNEFVIMMKPGCSSALLKSTASRRFTSGVWDSLPGMKGFGARLSAAELEDVLADPNVDFVECVCAHIARKSILPPPQHPQSIPPLTRGNTNHELTGS